MVCGTSKASDQRSLIRAFASRLNILRILSYWPNIVGVSKLKRRLHRLVRVYTCQTATLFEMTCCGSSYRKFHIFYSTCLCTFCILYINFTTENTSDILKTKNQNKEARFTCVVKIMSTPFALKKANIWSCGHFECNRVREKKLFCTNFDLCIRN